MTATLASAVALSIMATGAILVTSLTSAAIAAFASKSNESISTASISSSALTGKATGANASNRNHVAYGDHSASENEAAQDVDYSSLELTPIYKPYQPSANKPFN